MSTPPPERWIIIDPADLQLLLPDLSDEDAARACGIANLAVTAFLWPNPVPDPVPLPVYAATMQLAVRAAGAAAPGGGQVVSESIGAYSYRLANPATLDELLLLPEDLQDELAPWAPAYRSTAYSIPLHQAVVESLPVDWWQRDLDELLLVPVGYTGALDQPAPDPEFTR